MQLMCHATHVACNSCVIGHMGHDAQTTLGVTNRRQLLKLVLASARRRLLRRVPVMFSSSSRVLPLVSGT